MAGPWEKFAQPAAQPAESGPWESFQPASQAGPWARFGGEATVAPATSSTGTLSNLGRGIGERAAQIGGGFLRFAGQTSEELGDWLEEKFPLGKIVIDESGIHHEPTAPGELAQRQLQPVIDTAKKLESADLGYTPGTTWEDVKARPLSNFIPFALEQGIVSAPDMAAVMFTLPAYVASQTGSIGQTRAENDGRKEATVQDFLKAMPASVASALLERLGTKGVLGVDDAVKEFAQLPSAVAKGAAKEAGTEALQNPIEYAGGSVGTQAGFDPMVAAEQAAAGALGGAVFGGAARTATGTAQVLLSSPDVDAPPSDQSIEQAMAEAEAKTPPPVITEPVNPDAPVVPPTTAAEPPVSVDKVGVSPGDKTEINSSVLHPRDLPPSTQIVAGGQGISGSPEATKLARKAAAGWKTAERARADGNLESAKTLEKAAQDNLAEAVRLGFKLEKRADTTTVAPEKEGVVTPASPAGTPWIASQNGSGKEISPDRSIHVILRNGKYYGFVLDKGSEPQLLNRTFDTMQEAQQAIEQFATKGVEPTGGEKLKFEVVRGTSDPRRPTAAIGSYDSINEARAEAKKLNQASGTNQYKARPVRPGKEGSVGTVPPETAQTVAATGVNAEKLVMQNDFLTNNPIGISALPSYQRLQREGEKLAIDYDENDPSRIAIVRSIERFLKPIMKRLTPNLKLIVDLNPGSIFASPGGASRGLFRGFSDGTGHIWLSEQAQSNPITLFATLAHEYGHAVMAHRFATAGTDVQQALYAEFQRSVRKHLAKDSTSSILSFAEDLYSPGNLGAFAKFGPQADQSSARDFFGSHEWLNNWYSFDEWMAEQIARWMQSSPRIVSIADRYFSGLAHAIKELLSKLWNKIGRDFVTNEVKFRPTEAAKLWLEDMLRDKSARAAPPVSLIGAREAWLKSMGDNAKALDVPIAQAAPEQSANYYARGSARELNIPKKTLAQADRYVSWLRFWPNLLQLSWKNPHIAGLTQYTEIVRQWQIDKMAIVSQADTRIKEWRKLGKEMGAKLSNFLYDIETMPYLQPGENGRWPTVQELIALAKKHGLNNDAIKVYSGIKNDFLSVLDKIQVAWIKDAQRSISDPAILAREIYNIQTEMNQLRSKPYFPHERFGDWTVTVWNQKGKIVHFEQVATAREANRLSAQLSKMPQFAGHRVGAGKLAEEVKIFRGLPPSLIKGMGARLKLTPTQQEALDQIAFDMSPAQSFAKHFARRKGTPGFSNEGMRSYANYFLHAGSHIARLMWRADMEQAIKDVSASARTMVGSYTAEAVGARQGIADWLARHLEYIMNPQNEWTALRTFAFTWHLAFNISSALVNLTQVPMVAYPYLASRFGDLGAINQLRKAGTDLHKMYSMKGLAPDEIKAIEKGIQQGFLDESQSADLAGAAQHGVLGRIVPGSAVERFRQGFAYWGSYLFQAAEKVNRRVVFRAAYRLAKQQPTNKYVLEVVGSNQLLYQQLLSEGWRPENAGAFLVARDAIDRSMFNYSAYARPEFIRGKKGVLFAFYMFKQNMLYFFKNDPGAARALLVMFMTAGLMGLPFAQDVSELARFFASSLFGKDFDLEREARQLIIDLAGDDDNGRRTAEMFMHGMGKESMGLTWAGEGLGIPIPGFDISGRLGMGQMIPGLQPMLAGAEGRIKPDEAIGRTFQEVVGASYGVPLTILRAVESGNLDEFKTVERLMPAAARNFARALRYATEGETTRTGASVADFDVTDTQQAAEVVGMAMGFAPTRVTREWDKTAMTREAVQYWAIQRKLLFESFDKARRTKDREALADVREALRRYNRDVPDRRLKLSPSALLESSKTRDKNRRKLEQDRALQSTYQGVTSSVNSLFPPSAD